MSGNEERKPFHTRVGKPSTSGLGSQSGRPESVKRGERKGKEPAVKEQETSASASEKNWRLLPMYGGPQTAAGVQAGAPGGAKNEIKGGDVKIASGGASVNLPEQVKLLPIDKVAYPQKISEPMTKRIRPFMSGKYTYDLEPGTPIAMAVPFVAVPCNEQAHSNEQAQVGHQPYRIAQIGVSPRSSAANGKRHWYHPVSCSPHGKGRLRDFDVFSYAMHGVCDFNQSESMIRALKAASELDGKNLITGEPMKYKQLNVTAKLSYSNASRCLVKDPDKVLIQGVWEPVFIKAEDGTNQTEVDSHYRVFFRNIVPRESQQ